MSDKTKSAVERKLQILGMIPRKGKISIAEIETRLKDLDIEIGKMTVQRDIDDLSSLFPPGSDGRKGIELSHSVK